MQDNLVDREEQRDPAAQKRPSLRRRLMRAGTSAAAAKLLATATTLINYRLIASRLPDEEVSAYLVVNGVAALGAIFAGLGLGQLMVRRVRAADLAGSGESSRTAIRRSLSLILPAGVAAAVGVVVLFTVLPTLFGAGVAPYRYYAAGWLVLALLCQFFGDVARGYERFGVAAAVNSLNGGVLPNVLLTFFLLFGLRYWESIEAVFVGQLVGLALSAAVGWWFAKPIAGAASDESSTLVNRLDGAERRTELLAESLPMLASQLAVMGVTHFEMLLLGMYAPAQDVAAYGAIRRLMQLVGGPLLLLNASLPTFVVELFAKGDRERLQSLLRGAATACMAPALVILAILLAAPGGCLALFNPGYASAWPALVVFALANVVFVMAGSCGLVLRMTGFERWSFASALVTGLIYAAAAPFAAEAYGLMGVAVAGAVLIATRNIIGVVMVRRLVGVWCTPWISASGIADMKRIVLGRRSSGVAASSSGPAGQASS